MAVFPIVTGEATKVLHTKARKVKDPTDVTIRTLIRDMFESMYVAEGMGLAAPQIGISLRVAIIECDGKKHTFINPILSALSKEKVLFEEGCLSLPGQFFWIERSERLTVRYQDEKGNTVKLKASGLLAIALQHEVDHLDGTLIIDRHKTQKVRSHIPVWHGETVYHA